MKYKTTVDFGPLIRGILSYDAAIPRMTRTDFENVELGFNRHYATSRRTPCSFTFERSEGFERFARFDAFSSVDGGIVDMEKDESEGAVALYGTGLRLQLRVRAVLAFTTFAAVALWLIFPRIEGWIWLSLFAVAIGTQFWLIMRSMDRKLALWIRGATLH